MCTINGAPDNEPAITYPLNENYLQAIYTSEGAIHFSDGSGHDVKAASTVTIPRGFWNDVESRWDYAFMVMGVGESFNGNYIRIACMEVDGSDSHPNLVLDPNYDSTHSWSSPSSTGTDLDFTPVVNFIVETIITLLNPEVEISILSSLIFSFIGMMKGSTNGITFSDNHYTRTLDWGSDINMTGQGMIVDALVVPGARVEFTAEYMIFGPIYEYLNTGVHKLSITAPAISNGSPSSMTPEEREAAGIITVPKALLQTKASEIGIDNAQVQKMMNSDENEFYFTLDVPSCCKITSNDDSNIAISKESLLKSISEKISESERIVRAFSSDNVCNLHSSQEIVAKHSLRIDSLHSLEYMIKHTTLCQDSLERAYVTYMTLIERVNGTLSNFGNAVLLNDVSSDYIVEALNRGPAIVSSTLSGLKASAIDTLSNLLNDDVLLVSDDWLNADPARIERIIDFALSGHPIIMTGSNSRILSSDTNLPTVFSTSAGVYGLWHNEESGETYCYSDSDADVKDSIESAFEWAESHQTSESNNEQNTTPVDSIVYSLTKTHGNFGDLIIETEYDLMEIDTNLYLVTTHYTLTGDANVSTSFWDKWTAVADLRISGQHDHSTLVRYSPNSNTSTNGIQEVHLFHSYPINPHYDWEYGTGWTYNMDDAVFHDLSSQNNFSLWYDVNECQANNGNSYTIEPGTFSETVAVNQSTSATGSGLTISSYVYSEIEHYSVSFFRDRTLLPDQYETVECDMIVTLR